MNTKLNSLQDQKVSNQYCPHCSSKLVFTFFAPLMMHCKTCDIMVHRSFLPNEIPIDLYGADYYDAWGEADQDEGYWHLKKALFSRLIKQLYKETSFFGGRKALDLGCATGACLSVLDNIGFETHGLDINPVAVHQASINVPNASVVQGVLEESSWPEGTFDLIILSDFIEHLPNPWDALSKIYSLLAPTGYVLIVTPDIRSLSARIMRQKWPHIKPEHLIMFSQGSINQALRLSGFQNIRTQTVRKPMSLAYARSYFESYPNPLGMPIKLLDSILTKKLSRRFIFCPMGEMVSVALRPF